MEDATTDARSSSSAASSSAKTVALDTYGASGASTPGANHNEVVLSLTAMSPGAIHDSTPTGKVRDGDRSLLVLFFSLSPFLLMIAFILFHILRGGD